MKCAKEIIGCLDIQQDFVFDQYGTQRKVILQYPNSVAQQDWALYPNNFTISNLSVS